MGLLSSQHPITDPMVAIVSGFKLLLQDEGYIKIKRAAFKPILVVIVAIMGFILLLFLIKYVRKKGFAESSDKDKLITKGIVINKWSGLYKFSKAEIEKAINFGNSKVNLGSGSAGQVYQGVLPSGQLVAIKHIYKTAMNGSFTREVEGLSRIRHPNLVCLFGYCDEDDEKYLVYEYCCKGNLAQNLLRSDSVLSWDKRIKILRECALALRFLHSHPDGCIVHRDIKLTNILLTENMEAKLSDFGLAKMLQIEETKVYTDIRGTIGYMDPEYITHAKLTCASDIYGFGIVALQLLSGRKVIELNIEARDSLTKKAKDVMNGKRPLEDFIDPRLNGELSLRDFESILRVAVLCIASSSKGRPTIKDVIDELDKAWRNTSGMV
ncbi:probable serine/threonine-protein kinase PBL28 [Typha angustifolia]|uniref:probable serine/threonine-protein kinase PBL28 n=1 Tax=Typha angustifolia TaxID=59011 RepID=UPI003C304911